jgi:hypothetical protein
MTDQDALTDDERARGSRISTNPRVTTRTYSEAAVLAIVAARVAQVTAENTRMRQILAGLGYCPVDGEPMPCMTCGAGL